MQYISNQMRNKNMIKMKKSIVAIIAFGISFFFLASCGKLIIEETETIKEFESYIESYDFVDRVEITDNHKMFSSAQIIGSINIYLVENIGQKSVRSFLINNILREIMTNKQLLSDLCSGITRYNIVFYCDQQMIARGETCYFTFDDEEQCYIQDSSVKVLTQWWLSEIPSDPSEGLYSDKYSAVIYLSDEGYELRDRKTNNLIESKKWDEVSS